jgi:endonuclease-3
MSADQSHTHLAALLPPETYYAAHLNFIRLGREVCQARRPNCPACPVNKLCDYFAGVSQTGENSAGGVFDG